MSYLAIRLFLQILDFSIEPKSYNEVAQDEGWKNSMIDKIKSIYNNITWSITTILLGH